MKKGILILSTILLFGFAPNNKITENTSIIISENETLVKEIKILNHIIEKKLKKAELLETTAIALLERDKDSEEGLKLAKEAQLQRMMTLKYKAAIACKTHFSE